MMDLREILNRNLSNQSDIDLVDVIPIPKSTDPWVRMKSLEGALSDFDLEDGIESASYLIQVKTRNLPRRALKQPSPPSNQPEPPHRPSQATESPEGENIYRNGGNLNVGYLSKNADLLLDAKEFKLAKNIFQAILASGERRALALQGMGRCEEAQEQFDVARALYEESITFHPELETYLRLARCLRALKKESSHAEALERAATLKGIESTTRFELFKASANSWLRSKNSKQAKERYLDALHLNPNADDIRSNLGALSLQCMEFDEARRHFEDAIASDETNGKAQLGLGFCAYAQGDKSLALRTFMRALEVNLDQPLAVFYLTKCAYELKDFKGALPYLQAYLCLHPESQELALLLSMAGMHYHLGQHDEARTVIRTILDLQPNHKGAMALSQTLGNTIDLNSKS